MQQITLTSCRVSLSWSLDLTCITVYDKKDMIKKYESLIQEKEYIIIECLYIYTFSLLWI